MRNKSFWHRPAGFVLMMIGFTLTLNAFELNQFDGKSVELVAPDTGNRCVAGFGGDPTIKRINDNDPTNNNDKVTLYTCANDSSNNPIPYQSGGVDVEISENTGFQIPRDSNTGYWCFRIIDVKANVSYTVNSTNYSWTWIRNTDNSGFYNVKDFGALGNGYLGTGNVNTSADDTFAIRNAMVYVAAKLGGTLYFPEGVYRVSSTLVVPSGIVLKGTTRMSSFSSQAYFTHNYRRSNSTISLVGESKGLFRIGECVEGVKFENLTLKAESNNNTNGVEAVGIYRVGGSSQFFDFDNVAFDGFNRGMYFNAVDENNLWQIDFINVNHCLFTLNKTAGIHIDSFNSDWKISASFFAMGAVEVSQDNYVRGDGVIIERATALQMSNSFGGGIDYSEPLRGGTFIKSLFVGLLTVINSSAERLSENLSYGKDLNSETIYGSYSNVLTLINNGFGEPINLYGRVNFISTGNTYAAKTVTAGTGVRIYSTGDRFCLDLNSNYDPSAPCGRTLSGTPFALNEVGFQGTGTIVFQTGQPTEKNTSTSQEIAAVPAKLKGDLEIKGNEREWDSNAAANSRPILSATVDNDGTLPLKPLFRLGHTPYVYDIVRDTRGWLTFSGTQDQPYRGYFFSGAPFQIASFTLSQITASGFNLAQPGTVVYCSDCQRNTAPCQSSGSGALAVLTGVPQWDCK